MPRQKTSKKKLITSEISLEGQMLIAMPHMPDKRFARSVIYICTHTEEEAMGLILNQRADNISLSYLLEHLKIIKDDAGEELPDGVDDLPVLVGGPVESGRGFVLHSPDYNSDEGTLQVDETVSLTATIEILRAIAEGRGPQRAMLALGYAGWHSGQLESELLANGWLHCAADPDIVFDHDFDSKYERALALLGIDPGHLVSKAGHA